MSDPKRELLIWQCIRSGARTVFLRIGQFD